MDHFGYRDGALHAERVPAAAIAERHGTPCFVYSRAALEQGYRAYEQALSGLPHMICFAVKANPNLAVLDVLARLGAGFDIVSGGELERVAAAGGDPGRAVFSGPGKSRDEIERALAAGIFCFNIESEAELERVGEAARRLGATAPVAVRVNPDVDAGAHPYVATGLKESKFGVPAGRATALYRRAAAMDGVRVAGIDCHIGSQLASAAPFLEAVDRLLAMAGRLEAEGIPLGHLDMGGGLGVPRGGERPPTPAELMRAVGARLAGRGMTLIVEPGRSIAADAGILLTRVEYLKDGGAKSFAVVDGAMNDLLRPALYGARHDIVPVERSRREAKRWDVVGPVCESADFLGKDRTLAIDAGDLLAVRSAGAYGFSMSSNYNSRPRAAELMVDGDGAHLVRRRESVAELMALESRLP